MPETPLTDFLLARIAEDDERERDEFILRGIPDTERDAALSVMRKTAWYQFAELGAALRQVGWAYVASLYPPGARQRAARYADHPDYREEWKP